MGEEWRPAIGFEGLYEVSSESRIRSVTRKLIRSNGVPHTIPGKVLKQVVSKRGYFTVALHRSGRQHTKTVHRLLADAFIPNPDKYPVVRHLNDNPLDNRIENLAWGTQRENTLDAIRNGTHRSWPGEKTKCKYGHPFSEENTYRDPRGRRRCRTCRRVDDRKQKQAQRALKQAEKEEA